jgi:hypothetical protein
MKELFDKRFWRGVVKTFVQAREGVHHDPQPRNLPRPASSAPAAKTSERQENEAAQGPYAPDRS